MSEISISIEKLKRYIKLNDDKAYCDDQLDQIKVEMQELEILLIDQFAECGMQSIVIDGHTVHINKRVFASAKDGDQLRLADVLRKMGFGDLVKESVHSGRLSSFVNEHPEGPDGLPNIPNELKEAVKVTAKYTLRVRSK